MKDPIYPCLWFDGQAKAAADFYCSIIKNSKITTDTPMVVEFALNGKKVMGLNGGPHFKINPSISFLVTCESVNEVNEIWNKLIDGGSVMMPIDKYDWSPRYGWLKDKFGMTWQIMAGNTPDTKFKIIPCMLFTGPQFGKAEKAVKFYTSVFDNSSVDMLLHYPQEDAANAGKVMFSEFQLNKQSIAAMDGPGEHNFTFDEGVSFVVSCENQKEIDYYWNKLTEGGEESMCGWLKDKFGVSWQIVPAALGKLMSDPGRAPRVVQAFMKMKKFDIKKLEEA